MPGKRSQNAPGCIYSRLWRLDRGSQCIHSVKRYPSTANSYRSISGCKSNESVKKHGHRSTEFPLAETTQYSLQPVTVVRDSIYGRSKIELQDDLINNHSSEREYLQWASQGKSSRKISRTLGVTQSTVIYHLRNAIRKLTAANRIHAVTKPSRTSIINNTCRHQKKTLRHLSKKL